MTDPRGEHLENGTDVLSAVADGGDEVSLVGENGTPLADGKLALEYDAADSADGSTSVDEAIDFDSSSEPTTDGTGVVVDRGPESTTDELRLER